MYVSTKENRNEMYIKFTTKKIQLFWNECINVPVYFCGSFVEKTEFPFPS